MKLIHQIEAQINVLKAQSLQRRRRIAESACAARVRVDGMDLLAFCSNDYLGLANHPRVIAALQQGASLYGAGSGASHLISGHSRAHAMLEDRLAEMMAPHLEQTQALYFCTGYMANLAVLTALAAVSGKDAHLFSESMNHASLIDGAKLSRVALDVYPHGDLATLEAQLLASSATTKIVLTDSVFSMDGDLAPIPALLALCEKHEAWLVIDDAHGFGVLGEQGRGVLEHFNLRSPNVVYMGTLGKAAGVGGAFVAAHASVIDWLVQKARPYIYTTAAPPALAHALLASLDIIQGDEGAARRAQLRDNIQQLCQGLQLQQWRLMPSATAIQPLIIGDNAEAMRVAAHLHQQGFWVPAIRPPTVPVGTARLRITLSAAHSSDDVQCLVAAINHLEQAA